MAVTKNLYKGTGVSSIVGGVIVSNAPLDVIGSVTGPLTDTELRATPAPVTGAMTANAGSNLNTSLLATSGKQTDGTQKTQIVGHDGTVAHVVGENSLKVIAQDYQAAIVEGDIAGHTPFYHKGLSPAASAALTTLWNPATAYVFPVAQQQMRVISTSANDAAAGTGARTLHIQYLDDTYTPHEEFITLNGTTQVLTVATNIFRVNYFHVNTAGANGVCAGVVSLQNTAGTVTYSQIAAGQTVSRCSVYTVPTGKTLFISDVTFSAAYSTAGKSERMILHASIDPDGGTPSNSGTLFWPYSEIMLMDNSYVSSSRTVLLFPATTDIKVSVIGEANAVCTSELRGWIE